MMHPIPLLLFLSLEIVTGANTSLREAGIEAGIYMGSQFKLSAIQNISDPEYRTKHESQYSLSTVGNMCKWQATHPQQGLFDLSRCIASFNYSLTANQQFRGHNLCWGNNNPSWLLNGGFKKDELQTILQHHINTVMKGVVSAGKSPFAWDVVNEACVTQEEYDSNGGLSGNANFFKDNFWYPALPNYVDVAFTAARKANPNTLLLDAGDIFQGTPYFNYYGGELEFKLMSMLKYDLATIGNHDFDNGIEGLYKQLPHANFEFVSANYDFSKTVMNEHVKPYKIFKKNGIKIGVFGLGIELNGLVLKKQYKETVYRDPIEISQDMSRILKEDEQCDLIICLSHLGHYYKKDPNKISDVVLARATKHIDLIIGGHTHTFLKKPIIEKNILGENVLINQVGCYGLYMGKIDFFFDSNKSKKVRGTTILV